MTRIVLLSLLLLAGCNNQVSVKALNTNADLIEPMYYLGLDARMADPDQTIEDFLFSHNVSPLTQSEAEFMKQTMVEHRALINSIGGDN